MRILFTIFANLFFGNVILYLHEIYGRHQDEVAPRLWVSFSIVAVAILTLVSYLLKSRKSFLFAFQMSLMSSFLIPILGFVLSMNFSLIATLIGTAYLFSGFFFLILPMFLFNLLTFRWIQMF